MAKNKKQRDPIPDRLASLEERAAFWDTHDITDYPDVWKETNLKVNLLKSGYAVPLNSKLAQELQAIAHAKKTTVRRLVNRWLQERVRTA